jgi:sensor histidine kinase regulating citrate/malate metabolism
LAVTAGVFFASIIVFWHYDSMVAYYEAKAGAETARIRFEYQAAHYDCVVNHIDTLRMLEHDRQKHFDVLKALVAEGRFDAASDYVSSCESPFPSGLSDDANPIVSPDPVIGAILNDVRRRAKEIGLGDSQFRIDADISDSLPFSPSDVTVMLGNTVDNAFEALASVKAESVRGLFLTLKQRGNFLFYEISNTFAPGLGKPGHCGFGLRNVEICADKYGGEFQTVSEGDLFTATLILPLNGDRRRL